MGDTRRAPTMSMYFIDCNMIIGVRIDLGADTS